MKIKTDWTFWFLLLSSLLLISYTVFRASTMSMTHDESGTFLKYIYTNIFSCFSDRNCWESANNHLLNTWCMQHTVHWFGVNEFAIRLPNILAHIIYILFSFGIIYLLPVTGILRIVGFGLFNFHPFLIDFFCVTRGYGLCAAFAIGSLYYALKWSQTVHLEYWIKMLTCLFLAVMANFIAFNFIATIIPVTVLLTLQHHRIQWKTILSEFILFSFWAALIFLLLRKPIKYLKEIGEFEYGSGGFTDTFNHLAKDTLYGKKYFGPYSEQICFVLLLILIAYLIFQCIRILRDGRNDTLTSIFLWSALLIPVSISISIAQHHLLGSEYLINRKSILYIPLFANAIFWGLIVKYQSIFSNNRNDVTARFIYKVTWPILGIFLLITIHLVITTKRNHIREWWYDQNTKAMALYVKSLHKTGTAPLRLGVNWLFQPTTEFYRATNAWTEFLPPKYHKETMPDAGYDYYYCDDSDKAALEKNYVLEKEYPWGRYLMRRKDIPKN